MITREDFESFIMVTDGIAAQGREFVIQTGTFGADLIRHAMEVANAVGYVEWMEEKKKIDLETAANLKKMLTSEDRDNFNIAMFVIQEIKR